MHPNRLIYDYTRSNNFLLPKTNYQSFITHITVSENYYLTEFKPLSQSINIWFQNKKLFYTVNVHTERFDALCYSFDI